MQKLNLRREKKDTYNRRVHQNYRLIEKDELVVPCQTELGRKDNICYERIQVYRYENEDEEI